MSPVPADPVGKAVYDLDQAHVFNSWFVQDAFDPLAIARSEGCYLWDFDDNRYLDFSSQFVFTNVGYQHPKLVAALVEQAQSMSTLGPNMANAARSAAATALTDLFPDTHQKVFFTNGGADANENAIRMARLFTGRDKVLSAYRSYHGNTGAAIVATGDQRRWPNQFARGHVHFFGPFVYRSPFWSESLEQECERALEHLEQMVIFEGPQTIAAILVESMVGSAGVIPPPPGYLSGVRDICNRYGIVFIADEVMVGFGRTGKMFAFQHDLDESNTPDLVTFAKGVNSGYVPIGGVIIRNEISDYFNERAFPGGLTYSGHPLACATIVANLDIMRDEQLVENAVVVGDGVLGPALQELAGSHEVIGDVRGMGLFWAIDLVRDRVTKEPLAPYPGSSPEMAKVAAGLTANGLVTLVVGNRIHLAPPLTVGSVQVVDAVAILDEVLP